MTTTTYTKEEQAANRKKWVEALRSGKYTEAQGCLRDENGYGVLGVACEISGLGRWEPRDDEWHWYIEDPGIGAGVCSLPDGVQHWLGLGDDEGFYHTGDSYTTLADQEDDGMGFAKLADVIESEPYGLLDDINYTGKQNTEGENNQ